MAKLERITGKIFGATASSSGDNPDIGQFGSAKAGTYNGTGNVAEIQALQAWDNGWIDAVTPTQQFPTLPEMTGVHKVLSYQNAYLLKEGMPEYDPSTIYDIGGMCKIGKIVYYCTTDNNTNNPTSLNGWIVYYNPDSTASNLIPFCVNSGSVNLSGDGDCLQLPSGSTTIITKNFIQPILTANGTLGGDYFAVATSNAPSSAYDIWKAFDGDNSTYWITDSSGLNSTITIYNPIALNITQLTYMLSPGHLHYNAPEEGIISGSNDGTTWTQVGTYSIPYNTNVVKTIDLSSNTEYYKYYKWQITNSASGGTEQQTHWYHYISMFYIDIVATYQEEIVSADSIILKGSEVPVKMTNGYNTSYTLTQDNSLDMSSSYSDGTYNIFASITDGSLTAYDNTVYIQKAIPSETQFVQPILSSNGTPGGSSFAVFCSSYESTYGRDAWMAFDGNKTSQGWFASGPASISNPEYIGWYNPTPIKVTSLDVTNAVNDYDYTAKGGKVQYSDDGTNWTDETTWTNNNTTAWATWTIAVNANTFHKYWRLYVTNSSSQLGICEISINAIAEATIATNDVWLNTSVRPLSAYKFNGSSWEEFTGVPIGTATVSSNTVIACETRPYNRTEKLLVSDMPSNKYIELILGASDSEYTAPTDGWFLLSLHSTITSHGYLRNRGGGLLVGGVIAPNFTQQCIIPCKKGDIVQVNYGTIDTQDKVFRFVYAESEV